MEFALEMIIRAADERVDIREIPIALHPRGGTSKLKPFRDGWRHVHLILTHSPTHLFIAPGALMALAGAFIVSIVLAEVSLFGRHWFLHTLIAGSLLLIAGLQAVGLGLCGQAYAAYFLGKRGTLVERLEARGVRLKHGLLLGGASLLAGLAVGGLILAAWAERSFGALSAQRLAVLAATLFIVGVEVIFVSLLLSMLGLRRRRP